MIKRSQSRLSALELLLLLAVLVLPVDVFAQALPAAEAAPISTGFALPTTEGSLQYALSASESLVWGYYGTNGAAASTNLTGDLAYLSSSRRHPFSMILSAGRSFSESGQNSYSFADLGFSQVATLGRWNFVLSDDVSYLPGTAATGLSGIPGVGDLGVNPVQVNGDTGQGLLTNFSDRVTNTASGSVQRQITGKTSINASGSYGILRFLDSNLTSGISSSAGLDSDTYTAAAGINHMINVRNTFGGNYAYSNFSYTGNNFGVLTPDFVSQTASASYGHKFTRKFSSTISAGPQWTTINISGGTTTISLYVDVSATYSGKSGSSTLTFTRNTNNGYGTIGGAISDSVVFTASRSFAVVWKVAASSGYTHTSTLPGVFVIPFSADTEVVGIQISRAIARSLSGYASYTLENQSFTGASAIDVYQGLSHVVGFGLTFSPSALHLGRQ
jgi:hypothetical protein